MNIEKQYQESIRATGKENIDFWGINLTDVGEHGLKYKIYCSQKVSQNRAHPLVEFVRQKGMLRYFADVADSERLGKTRIDISLYQRNDGNMEELFQYLLQTVPHFERNISEVKKTAGMKITDVENYHFASLYHVGLIENEEQIELLKFHFFTRWCENPNHHTKEGYRDQEYLEYLQSIHIREYEILVEKAMFMLEKCGGHLWMAGMDISPEKIKYKIYLKNLERAYEYLLYIVGDDAKCHLHRIKEWNDRHGECRLAGIALALDSENVSSVNFYYHVD